MPEYFISIEIDDEAFQVDEQQLSRAVATVLTHHQCVDGTGVAIRVVDNDTIQQLNETFRGVVAPTDVLSFPAEMPPMPDDIEIDEEELLHIGDIALAFPYTQAQAARLNHALADTLVLLTIHGTLHLLGYDHDTPENREEMWESQARALTVMGVSLDIVPTLEENE